MSKKLDYIISQIDGVIPILEVISKTLIDGESNLITKDQLQKYGQGLITAKMLCEEIKSVASGKGSLKNN